MMFTLIFYEYSVFISFSLLIIASIILLIAETIYYFEPNEKIILLSYFILFFLFESKLFKEELKLFFLLFKILIIYKSLVWSSKVTSTISVDNVIYALSEKIKFISPYVNSLSLEHSFSGKENLSWKFNDDSIGAIDLFSISSFANDNDNNRQFSRTSRSFTPLLGVTTSFKNGISNI